MPNIGMISWQMMEKFATRKIGRDYSSREVRSINFDILYKMGLKKPGSHFIGRDSSVFIVDVKISLQFGDNA